MRHANWSGCYQRLCKVTATARGLDTAKCEQLVTTCHILQRMLVCACVCVCACVWCVRRYCMKLHVAYINRKITCCVTKCLPSYYLGKRCQIEVLLDICSFLVGLIPPPHCYCTELPVHLITRDDTHTHTHTHTHTVGWTPLDDGSTRRRDLYLTTHNTHQRQTFKTQAGFEPAIPGIKGQQTHSLNRAATGTSKTCSLICKMEDKPTWNIKRNSSESNQALHKPCCPEDGNLTAVVLGAAAIF